MNRPTDSLRKLACGASSGKRGTVRLSLQRSCFESVQFCATGQFAMCEWTQLPRSCEIRRNCWQLTGRRGTTETEYLVETGRRAESLRRRKPLTTINVLGKNQESLVLVPQLLVVFAREPEPGHPAAFCLEAPARAALERVVRVPARAVPLRKGPLEPLREGESPAHQHDGVGR